MTSEKTSTWIEDSADLAADLQQAFQSRSQSYRLVDKTGVSQTRVVTKHCNTQSIK